MTPPPKRYEILYGEELIGEFYEGDVNRYGDPVDDQSMIVEFNECVQNLGKRRNRREWRQSGCSRPKTPN